MAGCRERHRLELLSSYDPGGRRRRPLFRSVNNGGIPHPTALSDRSVTRVIDRRSHAAGVGRIRGHSLRAGAVTEAFDRGAPVEDVMALGCWKNPATALPARIDHRDIRPGHRPTLTRNEPATGSGVAADSRTWPRRPAERVPKRALLPQPVPSCTG